MRLSGGCGRVSARERQAMEAMMRGYPGMKASGFQNERAEAAEKEISIILATLRKNCTDDFVVIVDGAIDWRQTIQEFVSFIRLDGAKD